MINCQRTIRFMPRVILFLSAIAIASCFENKVTSNVVIADLDNAQSIFSADFIDSVSIISLQTDDALIRQIDKVVEFDTLLYVMDQKGKSLFIFSQAGKYLFTISNVGHATNEYIGLDDFFVNSRDSTINIVSSIEQKILKYNMSGTTLLKVCPMPKSFRRVACCGDRYIGFMGNYSEDKSSPFNFWIMDKDFHILGSYLNIAPNIESTFHCSISTFSEYNDKVYFFTDMSREVSCISSTSTVPSVAFMLDCGDANPPALTAEDYSDSQRMFELSNKFVMDLYHFQETDDYLMFHFLYQGMYYITVLNKTNNETKTLSLDAYCDEYLFDFGKIVSTTKTVIYSSVEAQSVYYPWKGNNGFVDFEEKYPIQVKNIRRKFHNIEPDRNPFLVKYYIKNISY